MTWGTIDAYLEHGPLLNTPAMLAKRGGTIAPQHEHYPGAWQAAYLNQLRPESAAPPLPPPLRRAFGADNMPPTGIERGLQPEE